MYYLTNSHTTGGSQISKTSACRRTSSTPHPKRPSLSCLILQVNHPAPTHPSSAASKKASRPGLCPHHPPHPYSPLHCPRRPAPLAVSSDGAMPANRVSALQRRVPAQGDAASTTQFPSSRKWWTGRQRMTWKSSQSTYRVPASLAFHLPLLR
jgi:hypothetical protein